VYHYPTHAKKSNKSKVPLAHDKLQLSILCVHKWLIIRGSSDAWKTSSLPTCCIIWHQCCVDIGSPLPLDNLFMTLLLLWYQQDKSKWKCSKFTALLVLNKQLLQCALIFKSVGFIIIYLFQFSDHPWRCLVLVQHVYKKTVENWPKFAPKQKTVLKCDEILPKKKRLFSWKFGKKFKKAREFVTNYSFLILRLKFYRHLPQIKSLIQTKPCLSWTFS
jgi:hypothetical protein